MGVQEQPDNIFAVPAVIPVGTALSGAVVCRGLALVALQVPADWTAANITLLACDTEAGTYLSVYDAAGTEVVITAAAARHIRLIATEHCSYKWLKIRSGTAGTPVNQLTADKTVKVFIRIV